MIEVPEFRVGDLRRNHSWVKTSYVTRFNKLLKGKHENARINLALLLETVGPEATIRFLVDAPHSSPAFTFLYVLSCAAELRDYARLWDRNELILLVSLTGEKIKNGDSTPSEVLLKEARRIWLQSDGSSACDRAISSIYYAVTAYHTADIELARRSLVEGTYVFDNGKSYFTGGEFTTPMHYNQLRILLKDTQRVLWGDQQVIKHVIREEV